jgi:hypothetical protein
MLTRTSENRWVRVIESASGRPGPHAMYRDCAPQWLNPEESLNVHV